MSGEDGITRIGWAREDRAHDTLVKSLARRVVIEGASWDIDDHLDNMWIWAGPGGEPEFKLTSDPKLLGLGDRPLRLNKIAGQPALPEAMFYRKLLLAFDQASPRPALVIFGRDGDRRASERRSGFEQVVTGLKWPFTAILAMPEPESEAWFVAGFTAKTKDEDARLGRVRESLNFDPVTQPHRLTSQPATADTDAKRVLAALVGDGHDRRDACLETELDTLAQNGAHAGLARLLDELREHLLPLLDPSARPTRP